MFKIKLIKENVENKTPLTKHEVQKLITRPKNRRFTEVKMWVIANLVLSTGIRSRNVMNSYQYLVKVLYLNIYGDEGYESSDTILQNKVSIYEKFGYANQ